jgi:tRNA dimethylallyltransferase
MNLGTSKPSVEEMGRIKHHFINNLSIHDYYSAGKFEEEVLHFLESYFENNNSIIMTGGSGLYIDAVCQGISHIPKVDFHIRETVKRSYQKGHFQELLNELKENDPNYFDEVDKNNPIRIMRAIEIIRQTGKKYSELRKHELRGRDFNILKIGLERDRNILYERINKRMDKMILKGLFDEARKLYPHKELNALQTVGYQEIFDHYDGHYNKEEAIRLLKRNTRRYAKRQLTWFKKDPDIQWFHPDTYDQIVNTVKEFIRSS